MNLREIFQRHLEEEQNKDLMIRCLVAQVVKAGGTLELSFKDVAMMEGHLAMECDPNTATILLKIVNEEEAAVMAAIERPNTSLN